VPLTPQSESPTAGPSALWLAVGFLLAGLGTVLLGPILPTLAHNWHLDDQQSGILLAAKFLGAFLGGVLVPSRLRLGILRGMAACCLGFGAFALCSSLWPGALALFVGGFGLGQIIASTNILAGRRYTAHTGSALALLNFFWSLGAVACGLLAALLFPRFTLQGPILTFAALFLVTGLGGLVSASRTASPTATAAAAATTHPLAPALFLRFAALLFLYGGLETCMTGWLTTYTVRFSNHNLLGGQSAVVLLWTALTAGRALSSAAMRWLPEATVQRLGLALSAVCIAALLTTHSAAMLSVDCLLLGLSLAPFFPSTFALLLRQRPAPRTAGLILAVSGLGAALFPWLMGFVSTQTGSLRTAMAVPLALTLCLLLVSLLPAEQRLPTTALAPGD
jgi:fucose permease